MKNFSCQSVTVSNNVVNNWLGVNYGGALKVKECYRQKCVKNIKIVRLTGEII